MEKCSDVAIIGAGPAGIAAAIQLKRYGINALLFEQAMIGGLLNNAYLVENYPGFPCGISGITLVKKMERHLEKINVRTLKERVVNVSQEGDNFMLRTNKCYRTKTLIIASGTSGKRPDIPIIGCPGKVLFEIYPIRNIRDKKVVIVGAGDAAFDYALNLARKNEVAIINRSDQIKGLDLLFHRIRKLCKIGRIKYYRGTHISTIQQLNNCSIVELNTRGKKSSVLFDYAVFATGREPRIDFLSPTIRKKYPEGDGKSIYFIGDVRHGDLRQTGIAIGDGILAAMKVHQHLKSQRTQG